MSNNLNLALNQALNDEFCWLDSFENPDADYLFSDEFENKMQNLCNPPQNDYLEARNPKFRKKLILILVASLALIISGCAVAHYYVHWSETQNDDYGTLDVEFEIHGDIPVANVQFITPEVPSQFTEHEKQETTRTIILEYRNVTNEAIIYSQQIGLDGMGSVSINNETDVFEETTINGHKGYQSKNDGVNFYIWSDGYCLYTLQGTCSNDVLLEIIKSIKLTDN